MFLVCHLDRIAEEGISGKVESPGLFVLREVCECIVEMGIQFLARD